MVVLMTIITGMLFFIQKDEIEMIQKEDIKQIVISIGNRDLIVNLEKNSSAEDFYRRLKDNHITIDTHDYGNFEKTGNLPFDLPTNDEFITTKAGDLILYQGNKICLYYGNNTYMFTKLGHVTNVSDKKLEEILGKGDVTYTRTLGIIDKNEI